MFQWYLQIPAINRNNQIIVLKKSYQSSISVEKSVGHYDTVVVPQSLYEAFYVEKKMIDITEPRVTAISLLKRITHVFRYRFVSYLKKISIMNEFVSF